MELIKWLFLALVIQLAPVLLIHEFGHYITALWAKVRILEAGLGYPPRILTLFRKPGVLRVEGVKMVIPPRAQVARGLAPDDQVAVLARVGEEGGYEAWRVERTDEPPGLDETAEGPIYRGTLNSLEMGTIYSLNLLPLGGFVRMLGEEDPSDPRSLAAKPKRWRLIVLLSGAFLNVLAAVVLMAVAYMGGVPDQYFVQIGGVFEGSAAEAAGFQVGDVVVSVEGQRLQDGTGELHEWIQSSMDEPITFVVRRDGEEIPITAAPRSADAPIALGISMQPWPDAEHLTYYSFSDAVKGAGNEFYQVFARIFQLPRMVSEGEIQPSEVRPTSVPGILQFLGLALKQSVDWGVAFPALYFTSMISLAIGLTNLLPLPALDGGRALFIIIEAVRGKRVSPNVEAMIHLVGLGLLLVLSAFFIIQDIINPIIPWSLLTR